MALQLKRNVFGHQLRNSSGVLISTILFWSCFPCHLPNLFAGRSDLLAALADHHPGSRSVNGNLHPITPARSISTFEMSRHVEALPDVPANSRSS